MNSKININVTQQYKSIQKDFEWKDVPMFSIITGVNGAGKTHLLELLGNKKGVEILDKVGNTVKLILASNYNVNEVSFQGLIHYHKERANRLPHIKQNTDTITRFNQRIHNSKAQLSNITDKTHRIQIEQEISNNNRRLKNAITENEHLINEIYEIELNRICKKSNIDINDLSIEDVEIHANRNFNHISEMADFERYVLDEENYIKRETSRLFAIDDIDGAKKIRDKERAYAKINRIFGAFGFDYFTMLNPFENAENTKHLFDSPDYNTHDSNRKVKLIFKGKKEEIVEYTSLSSGEQMIVKFVIWAMAKTERGERITTMLLDEPDAHLHPTMCKMMIDILKEISKPQNEGGSGIRIIMTTHSPSTAAFAPEGSLFSLIKDADSNRIIKQSSNKEAIKILSDGIIILEDTVNGFALALNSDKNNVLFVEGKTDVVHLNKAIEILDYDLDIEIIDMHDADTLSMFIRNTPSKLLNEKKAIALFDLDQAGEKAYKSINGTENNDMKLITAEQCSQKSFAVKIIAPNNILNKYCPIEFLYSLDYLKENTVLTKRSWNEFTGIFKSNTPEENNALTAEFTSESSLRPFKANDDCKNTFSEKVAIETDPELFKGFKPTLDKIKEIVGIK